jgi:hypothetical protein
MTFDDEKLAGKLIDAAISFVRLLPPAFFTYPLFLRLEAVLLMITALARSIQGYG